MNQRRYVVTGDRVSVARGADDQCTALERLWAEGEQSDPRADEAAWQTLRRAINASRREVGARPLFLDE